jgi:hypothetical protein
MSLDAMRYALEISVRPGVNAPPHLGSNFIKSGSPSISPAAQQLVNNTSASQRHL